MSASNPNQLLLEKVMEIGEVDIATGQYVLDVMGIEYTTKRIDFCQAGTLRVEENNRHSKSRQIQDNTGVNYL